MGNLKKDHHEGLGWGCEAVGAASMFLFPNFRIVAWILLAIGSFILIRYLIYSLKNWSKDSKQRRIIVVGLYVIILLIAVFIGVDLYKIHTKPKVEITLLYLFEHENEGRFFSSTSDQYYKSIKDGSVINVKSRILFDFNAGSKFIEYYIPSNPETYQLCEMLVNAHKDIFSNENNIRVESKIPGQQPVEKSDLQFSGRVFIYHEYPLFENQIRKLHDLYEKNGLQVQVLGTDYLSEVKNRKE